MNCIICLLKECDSLLFYIGLTVSDDAELKKTKKIKLWMQIYHIYAKLWSVKIYLVKGYKGPVSLTHIKPSPSQIFNFAWRFSVQNSILSRTKLNLCLKLAQNVLRKKPLLPHHSEGEVQIVFFYAEGLRNG